MILCDSSLHLAHQSCRCLPQQLSKLAQGWTLPPQGEEGQTNAQLLLTLHEMRYAQQLQTRNVLVGAPCCLQHRTQIQQLVQRHTASEQKQKRALVLQVQVQAQQVQAQQPQVKQLQEQQLQV